MRFWCTLVGFFLLAGCDRIFPAPLPEDAEDIAGFPRRVELGKALVGEPSFHDLAFRNRLDEDVLVELVTEAPFAVEPDRFVLGPNEGRRVRMRFTPTKPGPMEFALGLQTRDGLQVVKIRGEGVVACDPICATLAGNRCVPVADGASCTPHGFSRECVAGGTCSAGACVPDLVDDGTSCTESCGEAACTRGVCAPEGGARAPEWTFSRGGAMALLEATDDRIVVALETRESAGPTQLVVLAPDGTPRSVSAPMPIDSWRGLYVVGDRLILYREGRWRAYDVPSGMLAWVESGEEQSDPPIASGALYVVTDGGGLNAVDLGGGSTRWSARAYDPIEDVLGGIPSEGVRIYADDRAVFALANDYDGNRHAVAAFASDTGALRWTRTDDGVLDRFLPDGAGGYLAGARMHDRDYLCCGRIDGTAYAVDANGAVRWGVSSEAAWSPEGWVLDGPSRVVKDLVFTVGQDARDKATGALRYEVPVQAGNEIAQFVTAGASTFALDGCPRGRCSQVVSRALVAFDTETGAEQGRLPIGGGELDGFAGGPAGTALVGVGWSTGRSLCEMGTDGELVSEVRLEGPAPWKQSGVRAGDRWIGLVHDTKLDRTALYAWPIGR